MLALGRGGILIPDLLHARGRNALESIEARFASAIDVERHADARIAQRAHPSRHFEEFGAKRSDDGIDVRVLLSGVLDVLASDEVAVLTLRGELTRREELRGNNHHERCKSDAKQRHGETSG